MTKMDKRAEDREALERLLDIYGADRTRWPARERLRFAGIVGEDKVAARMLAEADALDRLLEQAPRASGADVEALKERIMAAALRSGAPQLAVVAGRQGGRCPSRVVAARRGPAFATRFGTRRVAGGGNARSFAGDRRHARLDGYAGYDDAGGGAGRPASARTDKSRQLAACAR